MRPWVIEQIGLVVVLAGLAVPALAKAAYQDEDELHLIQAVEVLVVDEVKDRCLPQPNVLKTEA